MEFIQPHKGALLIYQPDRKRVYLWPFGSTKIPPLSLSPDNKLVQSPTGQKVDHSDIGSLLKNIQALQKEGHTEIAGEEAIGADNSLHVIVTGKPGATLGHVHRYAVWLDHKNGFPVKVVSYDVKDDMIETVVLEDLRINPMCTLLTARLPIEKTIQAVSSGSGNRHASTTCRLLSFAKSITK